jgi:K+-sensing histidine kinase KdpD
MDRWLETFARANFQRSVDTAHDLKTPLNVAVLNLELLRMRLAKLGAAQNDEKIVAYSRAIESELRRMALIFDTFFLLSTPPKEEEQPAPVDLSVVCSEHDVSIDGPLLALAHESRIRQAVRLFLEGASSLLKPESRSVSAKSDGAKFHLTISGEPQGGELEVTKIFKFYYTDPLGNADLSLAAARLIAETYGGELTATERDNVVELRFSIPLGE